MGVYFYTLKGLGLSLPLKSVLVGGCLPALLEFQCEGAILALFIFITLLEAGLHVGGCQSVTSLLGGEAVFLAPVLWEDRAQRFQDGVTSRERSWRVMCLAVWIGKCEMVYRTGGFIE